MIRHILPALAFLSLFLFPWQVSVVGLVAASLFIPPAGVLLGLVGDLLYFNPGAAAFPFLTFWGALSTAAALLVHRFVKTRSIGG